MCWSHEARAALGESAGAASPPVAEPPILEGDRKPPGDVGCVGLPAKLCELLVRFSGPAACAGAAAWIIVGARRTTLSSASVPPPDVSPPPPSSSPHGGPALPTLLLLQLLVGIFDTLVGNAAINLHGSEDARTIWLHIL